MFKKKVDPDARVIRLQDLLYRYTRADVGLSMAKREDDTFKINAYRTLLNELAEQIDRLVHQINTTRV